MCKIKYLGFYAPIIVYWNTVTKMLYLSYQCRSFILSMLNNKIQYSPSFLSDGEHQQYFKIRSTATMWYENMISAGRTKSRVLPVLLGFYYIHNRRKCWISSKVWVNEDRMFPILAHRSPEFYRWCLDSFQVQNP